MTESARGYPNSLFCQNNRVHDDIYNPAVKAKLEKRGFVVFFTSHTFILLHKCSL